MSHYFRTRVRGPLGLGFSSGGTVAPTTRTTTPPKATTTTTIGSANTLTDAVKKFQAMQIVMNACIGRGDTWNPGPQTCTKSLQRQIQECVAQKGTWSAGACIPYSSVPDTRFSPKYDPNTGTGGNIGGGGSSDGSGGSSGGSGGSGDGSGGSGGSSGGSGGSSGGSDSGSSGGSSGGNAGGSGGSSGGAAATNELAIQCESAGGNWVFSSNSCLFTPSSAPAPAAGGGGGGGYSNFPVPKGPQPGGSSVTKPIEDLFVDSSTGQLDMNKILLIGGAAVLGLLLLRK